MPYPHAGWGDGTGPIPMASGPGGVVVGEPIPYVDAIWVPGYWHHYGAHGWG